MASSELSTECQQARDEFCAAIRTAHATSNPAEVDHDRIEELALGLVERARGEVSGAALADVLHLVASGLWHVFAVLDSAEFFREAHSLYLAAGRLGDAVVTCAFGYREPDLFDDASPVAHLERAIDLFPKALAANDVGILVGRGFPELGIAAGSIDDFRQHYFDSCLAAASGYADAESFADDEDEEAGFEAGAGHWARLGFEVLESFDQLPAADRVAAIVELCQVLDAREPEFAATKRVLTFPILEQSSAGLDQLAEDADKIGFMFYMADDPGAAVVWARRAYDLLQQHEPDCLAVLPLAKSLGKYLAEAGDPAAAHAFFAEVLPRFESFRSTFYFAGLVDQAASNAEGLGHQEQATAWRAQVSYKKGSGPGGDQ